MKQLFFALSLLLLLLSSCRLSTKEASADKKMDEFIAGLMSKMTIEEKIGQLNLLAGYEDIVTGEARSSAIGNKIADGKVGAILNVRSPEKIRELQRIAVEETRLGIPLIFGLDVIHGYRTVFPIPLALAASFDTAMVRRAARIAAIEATADGICWNFSPMVDLSRDPRWGRMAESAGEDPWLGARMAEAFVKGYQGNDLSQPNTMMACVKHFALYGASEAGRDYNTVDMSRVRMYNEYFPPYRAGIEAGAGSVMTAFNEVDGIPASGNKWLFTEVLRNQWGFDGFVVTDYTAINEMIEHGVGNLQQVSAMALKAGIDLDMVGEGFLTTLQESLRNGAVHENDINQACRRILEAKYKLGLFDDPYRYIVPERAENEIFTPEHNAFARQIAPSTFVLLKNDNNLLPLQIKGKIALVGPLADNRLNMAGMWSVAVDHNESITVLEGFQSLAGDKAEIRYAKGANITDDPMLDRITAVRGKPGIDPEKTPEQLRKEAVDLARWSDVVVAVVGEAAEMTGESASRTDLGLPGSQQQLLKDLLATGKPVVMVLFTGRPLTIEWEHRNIPAILNVWFGGTQSGHAVADAVFGLANPSGKLPVSFPRHVGQIPIYYNHKNTGRPLEEGKWFQKFRSNYLDVPNEPLYPFGYGLSYTSFRYGELSAGKTKLSAADTLKIRVKVTNTGSRAGEEVVQLYMRDVVASITRPVKELKAFKKIKLQAGEQQEVIFAITTDMLKFYDNNLRYDWEPGEFHFMVGGSSDDVQRIAVEWIK
ncbi:MAG TPA: beta-glucosidase BglX [Bacteroidales bacterium]|nr:beta-glucosidase BglX [Bacteroidales bacterium]